MEICKAPTLRLKALNKTPLTLPHLHGGHRENMTTYMTVVITTVRSGFCATSLMSCSTVNLTWTRAT